MRSIGRPHLCAWWCCSHNYIMAKPPGPFACTRIKEHQSPDILPFSHFQALPGHRSQHQPTQCKSSISQKQHHQVQSEGGHCYLNKGNPPEYGWGTGPTSNIQSSQRWWSLSDSDEIFVSYLIFSLWVLEFSALINNNNNNNNNNKRRRRKGKFKYLLVFTEIPKNDGTYIHTILVIWISRKAKVLA